MERLAFTLLCLLVFGADSAPFFYSEPDCYQPTEVPYNGYDAYQGSGYQETLQEVLRTLQEIVYLTVRAAKEELSQLATLWLPTCDPWLESAVTQAEISESTWTQSQPSPLSPDEQNTSGVTETSTLDNKIGIENVSSLSSSSSESTTNGNKKKTTVTQSITEITQEQTTGGSSTSSNLEEMVHNTMPTLNTTDKLASEPATDGTVTETDPSSKG